MVLGSGVFFWILILNLQNVFLLFFFPYLDVMRTTKKMLQAFVSCGTCDLIKLCDNSRASAYRSRNFFSSDIYVQQKLENSSSHHLASKGLYNLMPDMVSGVDCTVIQNIQLVIEYAGVI